MRGWSEIGQFWQLCADELMQATELQLLCIAPGSPIAATQHSGCPVHYSTLPGGKHHGSNHYSLYYHITPHGRVLLGYVPVSQSLPWCTVHGSGMCSLCTELENLACWHFPFLPFFPECSLDTISSFTALLLTSWQEGRLGGKRCISPFVAPSPPSVLH